MKTTDDFSAYTTGTNPALGADWRSAAATVGTQDTGLASPPTVQDDGEPYLAPGTAILADGGLLPDGTITRVSVVVDLPDTDAMVRVILPYNELNGEGSDAQYVTVEARRNMDGLIELGIFLTDPNLDLANNLPADHQLIAHAKPETDANLRSLLTVEVGPRMVRAWWSPAQTVFVRCDPDCAGYTAEIDHASWGVLTEGGKVRSVEIDTDPHGETDGYFSLEAEVSEPDLDVTPPMDTSRAVLVTYNVTGHAKRMRAGLVLTMAGDGAAGLSDHLFRRIDPCQTILLVPNELSQDVVVMTEQEAIAGPPSDPVTVFADQDPTGGDGGIGSGRTTMASGGELCIDLPHSTLDTSIDISHQEEASQTGGAEAYQEISSRQRRNWGIRAKLRRRTGVRRLERIVAASGGLRPVWSFPPLEPSPVRTMTSAVQHQIVGTNRLNVSFDLVEV